jgi:hypothetical protein
MHRKGVWLFLSLGESYGLRMKMISDLIRNELERLQDHTKYRGEAFLPQGRSTPRSGGRRGTATVTNDNALSSLMNIWKSDFAQRTQA